jgi:protein SCO1/2
VPEGLGRTGNRRLLATVLATVALVVSGCGSDGGDDVAASGLQSGDNHGYHGAYLDDPYVVPPVTLTDTADAPYTLADDPAPLKLVFFGYTKCPDICQVVMSTLASAVTRLDATQRKDVEVVFVTTDPARDTRSVLRSYLDHLDPDFVGVTGRLDRIIDLAKPLKVFIEKGEKLPSGGYDITHTTEVFGVTGDQARIAWGQDTSPADLSTDIIKLLKS